jgi:hypothetical protein
MAYGLVYTMRPAYHAFADIAVAYVAQKLSVPESVYDAFDKLKRIDYIAEQQFVGGLWDKKFVE